MSTENFIITKRDGSEEPFCIDKIKNAILKACAASNDPLNAESLERIMSHLHFCNGMNVENIQNQVEVALMKEEHYNAAKAFIRLPQPPTQKIDKRHKSSVSSSTTATPTTRLPVQSSMRTRKCREQKTSPPSSAKFQKATSFD